MRYRAVIFDLWQTLVPWPTQSAEASYAELARAFGAEDPERFSAVWVRRRREREIGPIDRHLRSIADELGVTCDLKPFGGVFDSIVFSATVGFSKPDPRIYAVACDELGVEPADCLFVGDGANDELPGAERAGMTAIQFRAPGERLTPEGERWQGRYVERLSDVLELA